jgi:hypothetical protein
LRSRFDLFLESLPIPIESELGFSFFALTRFIHANWRPRRWKALQSAFEKVCSGLRLPWSIAQTFRSKEKTTLDSVQIRTEAHRNV